MKAFQSEEYLQLIQKHKITRLQTVTSIMVMLSQRPEVAKYGFSSGKEMLRRWVASFSTKRNGNWASGSRRPPEGSIGVLMPRSEVMFVDDEGKEVTVGEQGEVYVRGPRIAIGYWKNEEATRDTFGGGWLKTGDVGVMDEQSFMWIVDREKELIKVDDLQVSRQNSQGF